MQSSKQQLLCKFNPGEDKAKSYESSSLSAEEMAVVIYSMQQHISERHAENKPTRPFNCFVVSSADDKDGDLSELTQFLQQLETAKKNYAEGTRFQFVFRYKAYPTRIGPPPHWMAGDVRIINGELEFCLLDPSDYPETYLAAFATIKKNCPSAKLSFTALGIQTDSENCGLFAARLAKIASETDDLHQQFSSVPQRPRKVGNTTYDSYKAYVENEIIEVYLNNKKRNDLGIPLLDQASLNQSLIEVEAVHRNLLQFSSFFKDMQLTTQGNLEDHMIVVVGGVPYMRNGVKKTLSTYYKPGRPLSECIDVQRKKIKAKAYECLGKISDEALEKIISERNNLIILQDYLKKSVWTYLNLIYFSSSIGLLCSFAGVVAFSMAPPAVALCLIGVGGLLVGGSCFSLFRQSVEEDKPLLGQKLAINANGK